MRWHLRFLTFLFLCLTCDFVLAAPERRVALVVGVSHYRNAPVLCNSVNDARLIAPVLERLRFQVQTIVDPDYGAMKNAIRVAAQFAETRINDKIEKGLSSHRPRREPPPAETITAGSAPA